MQIARTRYFLLVLNLILSLVLAALSAATAVLEFEAQRLRWVALAWGAAAALVMLIVVPCALYSLHARKTRGMWDDKAGYEIANLSGAAAYSIVCMVFVILLEQRRRTCRNCSKALPRATIAFAIMLTIELIVLIAVDFVIIRQARARHGKDYSIKPMSIQPMWVLAEGSVVGLDGRILDISAIGSRDSESAINGLTGSEGVVGKPQRGV